MPGPKTGSRALYSCFSAILLITPFLYLMAFHNYPIFHSIVEGISVFLSFSIFIAGERIFNATQKHIFLALSIAYFFIAIVDFLHLCTYFGMRLIPISDPNIPTQLWIVARYLEAASLVIATQFVNRTYREGVAYAIYGLVVTAAFLAILFVPVFPDCFILGQGLTPFKIASEFIVLGLLIIGIGRFLRIHPPELKSSFSLISVSMILIIMAEVFFTTYADVYGFTNFTGHILTVLARYIMYYAIANVSLSLNHMDI